MTTTEWFERFDNIQPGDVLCFGGTVRLRVYSVMKYGGVQCTCHNGEIIPRDSILWELVEIEGGKQVLWAENRMGDEDEQDDGANWWKK